jgi:hypothetical protein
MTLELTPAPEADLSAFVLHALDEHIEALHAIRDRMRTGSTTCPGGRRALALDSIILAERFAARIGQALGTPVSARPRPRIGRPRTAIDDTLDRRRRSTT